MALPAISIIIPVRNGGQPFERCLAAIAKSTVRPHELWVVDDGSADDSAELARRAGARVLRTTHPGSGPAVARNLAASHAAGDILFFFDADVEIRPDTLDHLRRVFAADGSLAAVFGSYDDAPGDPGFLSQYKNLFHHYVHQHAEPEASTFWSGCGAVRRELFLAHGGFSSAYALPSIEDIELGYRLRRSGLRLRLDKSLQVKHLKRWTLPSLLYSDIVARGIPWTRLILREGEFLNDLNLQTHNRISVVVAYVGLLGLAVALLHPPAIVGSIAAAAVLAGLNRHLYRFFARRRGGAFALGAICAHWVYYLYNGVSFGLGSLLHIVDRRPRIRTEMAASSLDRTPSS